MSLDTLNTIAPRHAMWVLLLLLRIPLIALTGYALLLFDVLIPDVAYDGVRFVVLDRPGQLAIIGFLIFVSSFAIRAMSDFMIDVVAPSLRSEEGIVGQAVWAAPRVLALYIGTMTGLKFISVGLDPTSFALNDTTPGTAGQVWATGAGIIYFVIGCAVAALPETKPSPARGTILARIVARPWSETLTLVAILLAALATFFLFWDWTNVAPAQFFGPYGVVILWVFAAVMYFTPVSLASHITRVPLILLLIIAGVTFSALNWNDNHTVRMVRVGSAAPNFPYYMQNTDLLSWLEARKNVDLYDYDHYPVIIVATEGGALRSAYFTARVLERLQAICPAFAHHVFAISSVSGGSVGAASYAAHRFASNPVRTKEPCILDGLSRKSGPVYSGSSASFDNTAVGHLFAQDFMAPALAALLFPDAFQRIWPVAIDGFDRAKTLECAFERALAGSFAKLNSPRFASGPDGRNHNSLGTPCSPLLAPSVSPPATRSLMLGDFTPSLFDASQVFNRPLNVPFLFFQTTRVDTGAITPVSTATFSYTNVTDSKGFAMEDREKSVVTLDNVQNLSILGDGDLDLPLSTAAFMSARFPYVSPAASVPDRAAPSKGVERAQLRFVDGGTFENSGAWFASEIVSDWSLILSEMQSERGTGVMDMIEPKLRKAYLNAEIHVLIIRAIPCEPVAVEVYAGKTGVRTRICEDESYVLKREEGLNELGSAFRSLYRTRTTRGYEAIAKLRMNSIIEANELRELVESCAKNKKATVKPHCKPELLKLLHARPLPVRISEVRLENDEDLHIPLSWTLSSTSRAYYDQALGELMDYFLHHDRWTKRNRKLPLRLRTNDEFRRAGLEIENLICGLFMTKKNLLVARADNALCSNPNLVTSSTVTSHPGASTTPAAQPDALTSEPQPPPEPDPPKVVDPPEPPAQKPPLPTLDTCEGCAPSVAP